MGRQIIVIALLLAAQGLSLADGSFVSREDKYGREFLHRADALTGTFHHIIDAGRKAMEITPERYTSLMSTVAGLADLKSSVRDTPILEC